MGFREIGIYGVLCWTLTACQDSTSVSATKTDLGPAGNKEVVASFASYKNKALHCSDKAADPKEPRILMTGFGPFQGTAFNISGVVVQSLANPSFWPNEYKEESDIPSDIASANGMVSSKSFGGEAIERHLVIRQKKYHVCFLILDVKWDLAAAIILHEAERFQPRAILMSGLGGDYGSANFEGGAVNHATSSPGFNSDGSINQTNRPIASYVLPTSDQAPLGSILMTWNASALAKIASSYTQEIDQGYTIRGLAEPRMSNDYICNNVSYVTLQALTGKSILLAGSTLTIQLPAQSIPAGFFHYPRDASKNASSVYRWGMMWAAVFNAVL